MDSDYSVQGLLALNDVWIIWPSYPFALNASDYGYYRNMSCSLN